MNSGSAQTFVAYGGNLGDPINTLRRALPLLSRRIGDVLRVSSLFKTKALTLNGETQQNYINAVIELASERAPEQILQELLLIERELGRDRSSAKRWAPRTIDLDLLLVGDKVMESDQLTLPHPEMWKRDFVLQPLFEIAPNFVHPVLKKTVRELEAGLKAGGYERFVLSSFPLRIDLNSDPACR